ncbi:N-formylglutamate amidohydrolase [Daeguia caeni]|uniref:N-formylglutamate amidohydrolase n=1 Tax=Daeguia caeni TaxID=439612 RepID=A0ABV9H6U1_9HYPH
MSIIECQLESCAAQTRTSSLLAIDEPAPYAVINPDGPSEILLLCEHASNRIPRALGNLGVSDADLQRHIAWDIGVNALSQYLSQSLDAALFMTNYSRLVIDCNRPLHVPSLIPERSETTDIPGNIALSEDDRALRINTLFRPYAQAVARRLDLLQAQGKSPYVIGIHSFTPVYFGQSRPWHVGILYGKATAFGKKLISILQEDEALVVGDNEPYDIHPDEDYTVPVHADARGLPGVLIEIRHDLIDTREKIDQWGKRLTNTFKKAIGA